MLASPKERSAFCGSTAAPAVDCGAFTAMLNVRLAALCPSAVAVKVYVALDASAVGVPLMVRAVASKLAPAGRPGESV